MLKELLEDKLYIKDLILDQNINTAKLKWSILLVSLLIVLTYLPISSKLRAYLYQPQAYRRYPLRSAGIINPEIIITTIKVWERYTRPITPYLGNKGPNVTLQSRLVYM